MEFYLWQCSAPPEEKVNRQKGSIAKIPAFWTQYIYGATIRVSAEDEIGRMFKLLVTGGLQKKFSLSPLYKRHRFLASSEQLILDRVIMRIYGAKIIEAYAAPDVKEHNVCTRCVFFISAPPVPIFRREHYGQRQSKVVR